MQEIQVKKNNLIVLCLQNSHYINFNKPIIHVAGTN